MLGKTTITNSFWHRLKVRRKGRKDGEHGVPLVDDAARSHFESQLLNRGSRHLQQVVARHRSEIQRLEGRREEQIVRLRNGVTKLVDEATKYKKKKTLLGRDVTIHIPRGLYFLSLGLIVAGEFALNAQAFAVFRESTALTWVMALPVAAGVPFFAHLLGIWIKQWPSPKWATAIKVIIAIVVTVGCLVGINMARQQYLLAQGVGEGAAILGWAFLMINLFVFFAAAIMASFAHDEDQELENLYKRTRALEQELGRTDKEIHRLGGEIDRLRNLESAEFQGIRHMISELVQMYRDENVLARADGKRPISFQKDVVLEDPILAEEMQELTSEEDVKKIRKEWQDALDGRSTQLSVVAPSRQAVGQ